MIPFVPFVSLFPGFREVPALPTNRSIHAHLMRERYGLPRLNDTHIEWEHEALAALAAEGYVASLGVWHETEADASGSTRYVHVVHPEAGELYVTYFLPIVQGSPVPERLVRSFIRR